ncbi:(-)-germacrene D synthase-like [Abrus precatorius]|uniref:(-)-germacrene D synthase-like n=1 Tax=Abrus precatorius TaxID=3816 RepID=A0A8B8LGC1_ABRPR|nr:(-)-germacrene D synthase-like [Abrus precatorius]
MSNVAATPSLPILVQNAKPTSENTRRCANFHPTIWGDYFLDHVPALMEVDEIKEEHIRILKEKVRKMLVLVNDRALTPKDANLIDSIQRLGLYYQFEHEIDDVLQHIHRNYVENGIITFNGDLHSIALVFRLLRQQGYNISSDVYKKFKNEQGKFNDRLVADVEGMLSLYEAAHLRIHGEDILEEALAFTSSHLELMMTTQLCPSLATRINHSLKRPLRKNLPRLVARHYISTYENDPSHDKNLLLLAKLDFNMLQRQHHKEISDITKWWKDLDFATKLPFARDRMVEAYFWILGVYFEPQYSLGRRLMTKVISVTSIIDDIYDVYGTLEELQLFTEAIKRWDISCMDFLPEYMRSCYQALMDVYKEIEQEMSKEGRALFVTYAKNEMKRLVEAYLAEAIWFNSNYIPTMEEYMDVALVTSAYRMLIATAFLGMGSIATEKAFQWLTNDPKIVKASTIIGRLMDDIVSNEFEQKRGHVASALECYMKQHSVTKQEANHEFYRQVTSAWKDINEECLDPTEVPKPLLMRVLNLSRVIDVLYKDGDCYTNSKGSTKDDVEALLLNPWPV